MNRHHLAGAGFLVAGFVALFRFGLDPAITVPTSLNAVIGVALCGLGFLWLWGDFDIGPAGEGRRIPDFVAIAAAVALFAVGIVAYVGV